jgi:hypothetical protein
MEIVILTTFPCRSGWFDDFPFVPDGPYRNKAKALTCFFGMLGTKTTFCCLGYFGHMWELYAFGHLHH